ncbi:MAG: NHLP bacteriocin export ABC transporter permease/ATPase subunit [Isosphaeraceae bacterium]
MVAEAQGFELPAACMESDDEPLRAIARAAGVRLRRVKLTNDWWKTDAGPLIGFIAGSGRPVALIHSAGAGYRIVDPIRGSRVPVNQETAARLTATAWMFLHTLPGNQQSAADLFRFAAGKIGREARSVLVLGAMSAVLGTIVPWVTATVVDEAIPRADRMSLGVLCSFLVAVGLTIALIQVVQGFALVRMKGKLEATLLPAVWDRLLGLSTRFFSRHESGELALRAMGVARVIEVLASTTAASLVLGTFSLANIGVLFIIDWKLGALATLLIAVPAMATLLFLPSLWGAQRSITAAQGQISSLLLALLGGISRIRAAGAERRAFARWAERYRQQLALLIDFQSLSDRLVIFSDVWPLVATGFVFAGVVALAPGSISTGAFLAFNLALTQGMSAVIGIGKGLLPLLSGLEQYERVRPILQTAPEVTEARGESLNLGGALRMTNVSFRYERDGPLILDRINLQVRPGEFVAVVGPSGSGKSTLFRLLLGFETPDDGVIAYDNRELSTLDLREVRRQVGVVLQDAQLLPGDIYANIVGFSSHLSYDDAWRAAELAGLADDIAAMPMGIHTVIGEGGGGLSSGQRQRLIFARALARHPKILFLDEATSALDNRSQAIVSQSIHLALQGTSRLAIAHRLSTVVEADRIYVLSEGRIVQVGRYAQLIREPGTFRDLARRQCLT